MERRFHCHLVNILGEHVSWVLCSGHFQELNDSASDLFLYPQVSRVKVPDFTKAAALRNANGGRCVAMDPNLQFEAQIPTNSLQP